MVSLGNLSQGLTLRWINLLLMVQLGLMVMTTLLVSLSLVVSLSLLVVLLGETIYRLFHVFKTGRQAMTLG